MSAIAPGSFSSSSALYPTFLHVFAQPKRDIPAKPQSGGNDVSRAKSLDLYRSPMSCYKRSRLVQVLAFQMKRSR